MVFRRRKNGSIVWFLKNGSIVWFLRENGSILWFLEVNGFSIFEVKCCFLNKYKILFKLTNSLQLKYFFNLQITYKYKIL